MEAIKKLLESTGLSADDLMKKLSEYKTLSDNQRNLNGEDKDKNKNVTLTNGLSLENGEDVTHSQGTHEEIGKNATHLNGTSIGIGDDVMHSPAEIIEDVTHLNGTSVEIGGISTQLKGTPIEIPHLNGASVEISEDVVQINGGDSQSTSVLIGRDDKHSNVVSVETDEDGTLGQDFTNSVVEISADKDITFMEISRDSKSISDSIKQSVKISENIKQSAEIGENIKHSVEINEDTKCNADNSNLIVINGEQSASKATLNRQFSEINHVNTDSAIFTMTNGCNFEMEKIEYGSVPLIIDIRTVESDKVVGVCEPEIRIGDEPIINKNKTVSCSDTVIPISTNENLPGVREDDAVAVLAICEIVEISDDNIVDLLDEESIEEIQDENEISDNKKDTSEINLNIKKSTNVPSIVSSCSEKLKYDADCDKSSEAKEEEASIKIHKDDTEDVVFISTDELICSEELQINEESKCENESKEVSHAETANSSKTEEQTETEETPSTSKRRPLMGCIRKRTEVKEKKMTKPPWLKNSTKLESMREKIFNQLHQLRMRKGNEAPLVDIVHPIPKVYSKRTHKPETDLGIKIVEVRGGVEEVPLSCDLIDTSPTIKVTKTLDITKIKGWRRKRLLLNKEKSTDSPNSANTSDSGVSLNLDCVASCSYPTKKDDPEASSEKGSLSVFASNNLDGFLTQQKGLNISYNVPNLESSKHSLDLLDGTVLMKETAEEKLGTEKRRRYTMAENEDSNTLKQNSKSDVHKPRTLAEKRKLLEQSGQNVKKAKIEESCAGYSSVYYNGKKLSIRTRYKKAIYIGVNHYKVKKQYKYVQIDEKRGRRGKPSILTSQLDVKPAVTYKPGPLCKKQFLQKTGVDKWEPVLKKLPKLSVDVYPKPGKRIHPIAAQFINFETDISNERIDFSLTALVGNDVDKKFTFDVVYEHNQDSILMRRKIETKPVIKIEPIVEEEVVENVVKKVVDDLITCLENSEIENTIIKEDPDFTPYVQDSETMEKFSEKKSKAHVIKGSARRTNLELKRLNVKVIEVNIEDDQAPSGVECFKPFCRMGCVCKSLNKTTLPSDHCGNHQCIFKCNCFYGKKTDTLKFVLPSGTDLLSERTVSRLQDEAKKDLAKVEKEFTQTVIHANNQTIVFGDTKDRKRRALKFPKRYEDYIETNLLCEDKFDIPIKVAEPKIITPEKKIIPKMSPCVVKLPRLSLNHVIPLCLVHNLYNCHCNCKSVPLVVNMDDESLKKDPDVELDYDFLINGPKRIKETKDFSARTKGAVTSYYTVRNQTPTYKKILARKLRSENTSDNLIVRKWLNFTDQYKTTPTTTTKSKNTPEPLLDIEKPSRQEVILSTQNNLDPLLDPVSVTDDLKPSRRKQVLITRDEIAKRALKSDPAYGEPAIQRRKKIKNLPEKSIEKDIFKDTPEVYKPTGLVSEKFAQLLGYKNSNDSDFRLLQWSTLMKKYDSRNWDIWTAPSEVRARCVIAHSKIAHVKGFVNIRLLEGVQDKKIMQNEIIRWILTREAPANKKLEDTMLILKKNNLYWEICGMCAKNSAKKVQPELEESSNPPTVEPKSAESNNKVIFKCDEFYLKELAPLEPDSEDPLKEVTLVESGKIQAELPNIQNICRWRMLKVNSTFSVLSFTRNNLKIKCSEIINLVKLAQREGKTIIINKVAEKYCHKLFGIYIPPHHSDKFFIGPYYDLESHDLQTLRYLNNKLVDTEVFCNMTGLTINNPTGVWYKQMEKQAEAANNVIDLTDGDDAPVVNNVKLVSLTKLKSSHSLLKCNNPPLPASLVEHLDKSQTASIEKTYLSRLKGMMKEHNLELPYGTYPVAFQVNFASEIIHGYRCILEERVGVYWPGHTRCKRFENVDAAVDWLQLELRRMLVAIPSVFQIKVGLIEYSQYVETINDDRNTLSKSLFEEAHVIGDFGVLKITDVIRLIVNHQKSPDEIFQNMRVEYREVLKNFLREHDVGDPTFAEPLLTQMKNQMDVLLKIGRKQKTAFSALRRKQSELEATLRDLTKRQQTEGEIRPKISLPQRETAKEMDVICLDSDEEDVNVISEETIKNFIATAKIEVPKKVKLTFDTIKVRTDQMPANSRNVFLKLTDMSRVKGDKVPSQEGKVTSPAVKLSSQEGKVALQTVKVPSQAVKLASPAGKVLSVTNQTPVVKKLLMLPAKSLANLTKVDNVERIDLSSFSTKSVSTMLGTNLNSTKVLLTKVQLNNLKILSEKSKFKRMFLKRNDFNAKIDPSASESEEPMEIL